MIEGLDPEKEYVLVEVEPRDEYSYIIRDEDGDEIANVKDPDTGDVIVNELSFTIPDTDVSEDLDNTPEPNVIDVYNQYVTANVFVSKTGELLIGTEEEDGFDYEDFAMSGVEFTIYAIDDIYHPDGKSGLIVRGGETFTVLVDNAGAHIARMNALVKNDDGTFGDPAVAVTETDGIARFYDLFLGHYLIRETKTIPGYATNFDDKEFTVAYDGDAPYLQYVDKIFDGEDAYHNERQKLEITIIKHDAEDESILLEGAEFGLYATESIYNARGQKIIDVKDPENPKTWVMLETVTTDENGKAVFATDLPQGYRYVIRELKAPDGYILNTEEIEIDSSYEADEYDSPAVKSYEFDVMNEQTKVIVDVLDDETNEIINGVHLRLVDEDGNVVPGYEDFVTSDIEHLIIKGLEIGKTYYIEEIEPAYGYSDDMIVKPDYVSTYVENGFDEASGTYTDIHDLPVQKEERTKVSFVVTDDSGLQVVTVFNERVKAELVITKQGDVPEVSFTNHVVSDITYVKKGLKGAEYDVYADDVIAHPYGSDNVIYEKGDLVGHYVTDETGEVHIPNLYLGSYRVEETKAPAGYVRIRQDSFLIKYADFKASYDEEIAGDDAEHGNYITMSVDYENPRQLVDTGEDYDEIPDYNEDGKPDENLHGDPDYNLYKKTGIYKYGVENGVQTGIANARFTLYSEEAIFDNLGNEIIPANTKIETSWTNDEGRAVFTNYELPIGKYYIVEEKAPNGYYGTTKVARFDTSEYENNDEVQIIRLQDVIENPPVIVKIFLRDLVTGVELTDASLRVEDANGKYVASWLTENTDGEGYVLNARVTPGMEYTITEVYPREGYTYVLYDEDGNKIGTGADNTYKFTVDDIDASQTEPTEIVINLYNLYVTGYVRIHKTGELLTDYDENGFVYEETDLEGVVFGIYAMEDIYHPDGETGYDWTTGKRTNGDQIPLFKKGELVKMNTQFGGGEDAIVTTDLNGIALFEGLYPGKYECREIENVNGFAKPKGKTGSAFTIAPIDLKTQHVEARNGLVDFVNVRQKINVVLTKLDVDTKKPVEGVVFGLYTSEDIYNTTNDFLLDADELIVSATSDADGLVKFDCDLPAGHYYIKELTPAEGYTSNYDVIEVDATWKSDGREVVNVKRTVTNEKTKVRIIKKDENGNILGDATLAVYTEDGQLVEQFNTSVGCPFYRIDGLTPGAKYILREEKPAPGYASADYKCFRVKDRASDGTYEPQEIEMIDEPIKVSITVNEIDDKNMPSRLAGVEYHIEDASGKIVTLDEIQLKYRSDGVNDTSITKIPVGEYKIVVDSVPEGYINPGVIPMNVADTTTLQNFTVNVPYTKIEITAVDKETGKVLSKVKADIMTADGDMYVEDASLALRKDKVAPGDYLIHVTQGPSGYMPPAEDTPFTVKAISDLQKFKVELDYTKINVIAIDQETGAQVSGVKINMVNKNGASIAYDEPLTYAENHLPSGVYTVTTTKLPNGYITPEAQEFYVKQTSELQTFIIPLYTAKAAIRAVDSATNKPVKGVKLKLYGPDGSVYATWTTTKGWEMFKPITPGTYMLETVKVPKGYQLPATEQIKIDSISDMQYFEVKLAKKTSSGGGYRMGTSASAGAGAGSGGGGSSASASGKSAIGSPATGDDLNLTWLYLALAIEMLLAVVLIWRRRKEKR